LRRYSPEVAVAGVVTRNSFTTPNPKTLPPIMT
jgi:hypothetical protein